MQARSTGCPTERRPSPQGARKNNEIANDKGATARIANLDLDLEVLKRIQLQLDPPHLLLNTPGGLQTWR